jgi:hypothetical protein
MARARHQGNRRIALLVTATLAAAPCLAGYQVTGQGGTTVPTGGFIGTLAVGNASCDGTIGRFRGTCRGCTHRSGSGRAPTTAIPNLVRLTFPSSTAIHSPTRPDSYAGLRPAP